jgi:hypothetical protein
MRFLEEEVHTGHRAENYAIFQVKEVRHVRQILNTHGKVTLITYESRIVTCSVSGISV